MPEFAQSKSRTQSSHLVSPKRSTQAKAESAAINPFLVQQQALGNQAVQRLLRTRVLQAKLKVGQPGDVYEQEADRVAEQVMSMPDSATQQPIQRESLPEEEELQMKPLADAITPLVQREALPEDEEELQMKPSPQRSPNGGFQASSNLESRLSSSQGGGSPLPDDVRSFMEPRFGADFSQVRVHTGSESVQMNQELNAQAFAHKQEVYFGAGKAPAKDALTAHELTHVVQQSGKATAPITVPPSRAYTGPGGSQPLIGNITQTMPGFVQRSWIGDRINWVRTSTATPAENWAKPDPPGAYYILNGLSMDDMVWILRALTPAERKKLSDNLDEHAAGFDRSRLQLGLANAATAPSDSAFRELSENLHWAIRSGNFATPPNGAFYLLAAAKGTQRDRLLAALNRDALEVLVAHRDEASTVPGGADALAALDRKSVMGLPWGRYVDGFVDSEYNIDYKRGDGPYSNVLLIKYYDGATLEFDIFNDLVERSMTSEEGVEAMKQGRIGRGGRIFPSILAPRTAPRLFAVRNDALQMQNEEFKAFAQIAMAGVVVVLSVPAMPAGPSPATGVPSPKVTRRYKGAPLPQPATKTPADILMPGGSQIGKPGTSSGIRRLNGGMDAAKKTFDELAAGGTDITPSGHPGKLVKLPDGSRVGFRPVSSSADKSPAIDIDIPGIPVKKIHFEP